MIGKRTECFRELNRTESGYTSDPQYESTTGLHQYANFVNASGVPAKYST